MPAVLDRNRPVADAASRLRGETAAVRLSFTWFGVRKCLSAEQKAEAAEPFGATGRFVSASKKLLDTRHPSMKRVAAVRRAASEYFRGASLPFPEPAVRLVRRNALGKIERRLSELSEDLREAVAELDIVFDELRIAAHEALGRLYQASDYPASVAGLFAMTWDLPSVEPPEYLQELSPRLYAEESRRVAARFDEAVELAEQMFFTELSGLVGRLRERLAGDDDGKPKIFRDSAVENLTEFFSRFRRLNIGSSAGLDSVVEDAMQILDRVSPQSLRDSSALRRDVTAELIRVEASLEGLMVDQPRRNLMRRGASPTPS